MFTTWTLILCVTLHTGLTLSQNTNKCCDCSTISSQAMEDFKLQMNLLQRNLQAIKEDQVKTAAELLSVKKQLNKVSMCQLRYGTSCYYFVKERVVWQTALQGCINGGAQLVAINNAEENTFLQNYIRSRPDLDTKPAHVTYHGYWISANDQAQEGRWVWAGNNKVVSYFNWNSGEPNGGRGENCVHMWKRIDWKWNDVPCVHRYGYICEIPNIAP